MKEVHHRSLGHVFLDCCCSVALHPFDEGDVALASHAHHSFSLDHACGSSFPYMT